jgi:predicted transcriptional regulator
MDMRENGERYARITEEGKRFIGNSLLKMPKYQTEILERSYRRKKAKLPSQEYSFKLSTHESF